MGDTEQDPPGVWRPPSAGPTADLRTLRAMQGVRMGDLARRLGMSGHLKVPELTAMFWIIKLLSTAMGESTSDYLVFQIDPYVAVVLACLGLVIVLALQLRTDRYVAWIYWLTIVMVAVFGTMVADVLHVVIGIPYARLDASPSAPPWPSSSRPGTGANGPCRSTASTRPDASSSTGPRSWPRSPWAPRRVT